MPAGPSPRSNSLDEDTINSKTSNIISGTNCTVPRARIFLVSAISFVLATVIVLIVILSNITEPSTNEQNGDIEIDGMTKSQCLDYAIFGADMAGLYASWYLRNRGVSVTLYESSDRIGKFIDTRTLPNFPQLLLEFGEWYFGDELFWALNETLSLELDVMKLSNWEGATYDYVRGELTDRRDVLAASKLYNLKQSEIVSPSNLYKSLFDEDRANMSNPSFVDMRVEDLILLKSKNTETRHYLEDLLEHRLYNPDTSASGLLHAIDYASLTSKFTMQSGMHKITQLLLIEFLNSAKQRNDLQMNQKVKRFEVSEEYIQYSFETNPSISNIATTQCAKNVILSLSPAEIELLQYTGVHESEVTMLNSYLTAITKNDDVIVHVLYSSPWWRQDTGRLWMQTDTPLKVVVDLGTWTTDELDANDTTISEISVLKLIPNMQSYSTFWNVLKETSVQDQLVLERCEAILTDIFDIRPPSYDSDNVTAQVIHGNIFSHFTWKAGSDWSSISKNIMQPFPNRRLFHIYPAFAHPKFQSYPLDAAINRVNELFSLILPSQI